MQVVICEDLVLLREGIGSLLADEGHEVVAAVGDGEALIAAVDEHHPKLAIIDVRLPPTQTDEGVRAALEVRRRHPDVAILILSQYARSATPPTCSAAAARASATCSRTAWPTCASSSPPPVAWPPAAPRSTPRWCPSC
jgi:DNA-binding NarL/FixJ family response regulator